MPSDTEQNTRSEIIRAFHGVSSTGNWFLLADLAPGQPDDGLSCLAGSRTFDASWLVILGRRDRAIITLQEPDA